MGLPLHHPTMEYPLPRHMRPGATIMFQSAVREKLDCLEIVISNLESNDMADQPPWMIEIHNTTKKITKRLSLALSYMHNGNEKKYTEYREKVRTSMSDELILVRDAGYNPHRQTYRQANGIKFWDAVFKDCEESATYIRHWN